MAKKYGHLHGTMSQGLWKQLASHRFITLLFAAVTFSGDARDYL
jgi:hypothetical protein